MALTVQIEKQLGNFLLKVDFSADNHVLALLGASGCGKSMTLKCIAGIETPDRGKILLDDVTLFDSEKHINLTPQKRRVGYLFQQYALFPNMTVNQNILCGIRDKKQKQTILPEIIRSMHLEGLEQKRPYQLSGGQQQRVALARILVNEPEVLMLDEPFSALDSHLRFALEREVREVISGFGKTVLLVSHDRDEVFRLSDSVAIMEHGTIQAIGPKHKVFENPQTVSGARLTGCKNISRAVLQDRQHLSASDWGITVFVPEVPDGTDYIGIRLHHVLLGTGSVNSYHCRVIEEIENPFSYTIMLQPIGSDPDARIGIELDKHRWLEVRGEEIDITLPPESILLMKG